jgi:hypothetical protein
MLAGAALVVPVLPAAPAYAVDNVICVNTSDASCTPGQNAASVQAAITVANNNNLDDTILVGPGTYGDGPYLLDGSLHALTLRGAGEGSTTLTAPETLASQSYLQADHAVVADLTVLLEPDLSGGDKGLWLGNGASSDHVTVVGPPPTTPPAPS